MGCGVLRGFVLALTTGYGIVTALVFACAITFIIIRFSVNNTDLNATKEVDDRGVATSMAGTYGTARWMNETEAKKVYEVGPVENVTGTILGQFTQDGEEVIALPFEPTGNRNLILIGPPGSGKSFGYVRTAVFQSIVRGESVVVTDPKGEIHNDMRKLLSPVVIRSRSLTLSIWTFLMHGIVFRKFMTRLPATLMTSV